MSKQVMAKEICAKDQTQGLLQTRQRSDSQAWGGALEARPGGGLHPAPGDDIPYKAEPADMSPTANASIKDDSVEPREFQVAQTLKGDGAVDKLVCCTLHCGEIAQIQLDGRNVDSVNGILWIGSASCYQSFGRSGPDEVLAEPGDRLCRL